MPQPSSSPACVKIVNGDEPEQPSSMSTGPMTNRLTMAPKRSKRISSKTEKCIHLVLAHGAGAPMTSPFMEAVCTALADFGVTTTRFEFAYMAARREGTSRRPPPKAEKLIPEFLNVLEATLADVAANTQIAIGGKSMGGRVASMMAQQCFASGQIRALVCLGYPFHPPRKPTVLRTAHLMAFTCPALIVQGERDALGDLREVEAMDLPRSIKIHWSPDGDHDLKPRVRSGHTHESNIREAAKAIAGFLKRCLVTDR